MKQKKVIVKTLASKGSIPRKVSKVRKVRKVSRELITDTSPTMDFSGGGGFWGRTAKEKQRLERKFERVPLDQLTPWKDNPRINQDAVPVIASLIKQHGFAGVIVATPDGVIRAGHTRYEAMLALQDDPDYKGPRGVIDVHWMNFPNEAAAEAYSLADNKSAERSDWDHAKLASLFRKRNKADMEMLRQFSGFHQNEIDWQGPEAYNLNEVPEFEEPVRMFVLRIDDIVDEDIEIIRGKVEKALEGTPYNVKTF